jgi:hypothetical protein
VRNAAGPRWRRPRAPRRLLARSRPHPLHPQHPRLRPSPRQDGALRLRRRRALRPRRRNGPRRPAAPGYAPPAPQPVYVIGEQKPRRAVPAWLAAVLTVAVLGGALFGLYRYVSSGGAKQGAGQKAAPFERPAPQASASSHPFAKYIEVTGVRFLEKEDKTLAARFLVVNHSPAQLGGFRLRITLEAANSPPGEAVIAVVDAAPGAIAPHGSKEMEAPLVTHLKMYELPDWQFVRARVEIIDLK